MQYRRELDGLRAVALVPIMLFHAGFGLFSGGFVGVDVFFVISGYLITAILIEDSGNQQICFINFYAKRARRILPALLFVMLCCIPFAWMWMRQSQMLDFSQSLTATSLFFSNILFWRESHYFASVVAEKPLIHTWSLSIEVQFYILFPIFLATVLKVTRQNTLWVLLVVAIISFMLSEWGWRNQASANYYLAPSRVWEFFVGAIATFLVRSRGIQANNYLATLGLIAIIYAVFTFDKNTPWPSIYTLYPVFGAVLIILYAEENTFSAKLLSTRPLVGIGLISYSAYLWHQPLFAFARIRMDTYQNKESMLVLCLACIILAWLTWEFIEKPGRRVNICLANPKLALIFSATTLLPFTLFGFLGSINDGYRDRIPAASQVFESPNDIGDYLDCKTEQVLCAVGNRNSKNRILVYGDSHIRHITSEFVRRFEMEYAIDIIVDSGCFMGTRIRHNEAAYNKRICSEKLKILNGLKGIWYDIIVTGQRWHSYGAGSKGEYRLFIEDRISAFGMEYGTIIVLGANPDNPIVCYQRNYLKGKLLSGCSDFPNERLFENVANTFLADKVYFIHPYKNVEKYQRFQLTHNHTPVYSDSHHLSKAGSAKIVRDIASLLEK